MCLRVNPRRGSNHRHRIGGHELNRHHVRIEFIRHGAVADKRLNQNRIIRTGLEPGSRIAGGANDRRGNLLPIGRRFDHDPVIGGAAHFGPADLGPRGGHVGSRQFCWRR